jgi:S-DNA-T family DNA segregation ATPase FtsK/SpoIIIE
MVKYSQLKIMPKKKKKKQKKQLPSNLEKKPRKGKGQPRLSLPDEIKRLIWASILFVTAIIVLLSFFNLAGSGGEFFIKSLSFLFGDARFAIPILLILGGLALFGFKYRNKWPVALALILLSLGLSGTFEILNNAIRRGGWVGYLASWPLLKVFGVIATQIIFAALILIGMAILWQFLYKPKEKEEVDEGEEPEIEIKRGGENASVKKIFGPKFKVKSLESEPIVKSEKPKEKEEKAVQELDLKPKLINTNYKFPPLDLLEIDKGEPTTGDIRINSAIIKRTLQNFDIQVEMSEVNIGPTVTQYTLKPAEGVKLTRITSLSNDLSLALSAHPIRIEAPIPGRPLVGIEVPNSTRTIVRLKNMLENQKFQNASSRLTLALGRDVAGFPVFADLARMPHLLVAGSTGTGKTICLNTLITTLLYGNSPETLRLILIDPKRVEFPVYNELPHLLTPVICDPQRSVNAFKWLIGEMERRFEVLSEAKARDIVSYNEKMTKDGKELLPYIVLVVDELADLMASRGREIEASIVRLAQMARAVGIHLILATQRPSTEVITGLIKANITSRITFQVASQIDSRTVLDAAGAEKLLGAGDMLFITADISKPKRAQGAYVSDKEVRKVVNYIKEENQQEAEEGALDLSAVQENSLAEGLEKIMENGPVDFMGGDEDPLYDEAKKVVIESKKASASLLQRRLRVGYARAARLIDMLEERNIIGPGEGAKPREILVSQEGGDIALENEDWKKI